MLDDVFIRIDIKRNNCFSLVVIEVLYNNGEFWLELFLEYLEFNIDFVIKYINENMLKFKVRKLEGIYLLWVDFSVFGLSDEELESIFV